PQALQQQPRLAATGKLDAADIRFTAGCLGGDLVELPAASLAVDAAIDGRRLSAKELSVHSEWCEVQATGEFDLAQLAGASLDQLPASDASLTARVDLPQLTRMLPRTLGLRPGVRIDSGNIE